MYELVVELALEFGDVIGYGLAATALAGLGLLSELTGLHSVTTGHTLGYWFLFMGLVALAAAYLVTVDELVPRLRSARADRADPESR